MKQRQVAVAVSLALALPCLGCGGYFPLRWPKRELWTPSTTEPLTITLPLEDMAALPARVEQEHVTVAAGFPDPERTATLFHANLLRNRVQPLLLMIHNGSHHPYRFSKADVNAQYVPTAEAARWACVHPAVTAARLLKWGVFLLPGLVVESVIEPATTLDFPVLEESARRPTRTDPRQVIDEFQRHEIADGQLAPDDTRSGVMFIRPPRLGSVIAIRLVNAHTQHPLVVELPTPPPVYVTRRAYPGAYETVWDAAVKAAGRIKSWRVTASDPKTGVIAVRHGLAVLLWSTAVRITITVERVEPARTQVTVQSTLRRRDTTGLGDHSPTIERFLFEMDTLLPRPAPPPDADSS